MTAEWVEYTKKTNIERLVSYLNGVGASIINAYPMAEVQSWTIQRDEAQKVIDAGNSFVPTMAPFLTKVCEAQFGAASTVERIAQVKEKAVAVKANAELWANLSAYVNGLRARSQKAIEDATTESDTHRILHEAMAELELFRSQFGI